MSFTPGFRARILLDDFSLSAKLADASLPFTVDMLDVTTFEDDGDKRFIPGLDHSTASFSGFVDADAAGESTAWTATEPVTYAPWGLAAGSDVFLLDALRSNYEVGTQVGGVASFDLSAETDGHTDIGQSLGLLTLDDDGTGSAVDGGAGTASGGVAQLHVLAYSGLDDVDFTVEGSANGTSGWATVATFTNVTGTGSERVVVTGAVARYLRVAADVTGTGSVTFQASFARR